MRRLDLLAVWQPRQPGRPARCSAGSRGCSGRGRSPEGLVSASVDGSGLAAGRIDSCSCGSWAELVACRQGNPTNMQASTLARGGARELKQVGWRLERVLTDNGGEFRSRHLRSALKELGRPARPDPRRSPADRRPRRSPAPADPRSMLAARLGPLPVRPLPRGQARPRRLHPRLQPPPRPPHPRPHPRRHRLRRAHGEGVMSRECRHVAVIVQLSAPGYGPRWRPRSAARRSA